MKYKAVSYSRGQIKIQEMAFVIVALVVFFAIVAVLVVTIAFSGMKGSAQAIKDESARQLVSTLASSPEFMFSKDCSNCVDKDKLFLIKKRSQIYDSFWGVQYLAVQTIYPEYKGECTGTNYPECGSITLINNSKYYGVPSEAYIDLCRETAEGPQCDVAKLFASIGSAG